VPNVRVKATVAGIQYVQSEIEALNGLRHVNDIEVTIQPGIFPTPQNIADLQKLTATLKDSTDRLEAALKKPSDQPRT